MSNYLDRFKMAWIPNLIEAYPCGAINEKEICYIRLQRNGSQSPKSDDDMTTGA